MATCANEYLLHCIRQCLPVSAVLLMLLLADTVQDAESIRADSDVFTASSMHFNAASS